MKSLILATLVTILSAGSASAGAFFLESDTEVTVGDGTDTVLTTVGLGYATSKFDVVVGGGYADMNNADEFAVKGEARYGTYLGADVVLESEVKALYLTGSDEFTVTPSLKLRKYFF